jgi:hypothetical protein
LAASPSRVRLTTAEWTVVPSWNSAWRRGFVAHQGHATDRCGEGAAHAPRARHQVGSSPPAAATHTLQLEVHYNNVARHEDIKDKSGVRICASSKLRKNTAAVHILGSTQINLAVQPGMQDVVNGCKIASNMGPITIMSASPHMHQLGRHMKTTVRRVDGSTETLVDVPFDFRDQTFYPKTMIVNKGDILTTTCTWENTSGKVVTQGEGTGDEMCFNFVTAYPAGALTGGISPLVSSTQNTCIGIGAEPFPILDI